METPTISDEPKQKTSKFALISVAVIVLCLLLFLTAIGLLGWGGYTLFQQAEEKSKIPYATATAAAQWPVVFHDDFKEVTDQWYTGDSTKKGRRDTRSISNGVYNWTLENALGYIYLSPANAGSFTDFALSVDVRQTDGSKYDGYGLIFCNTADNYYTFVIQDAGFYSVMVRNHAEWDSLIPLSRSSTIKPGESNHLMVLAENGTFKLFINNEYVNEFRDSTLSKGDIGLMFTQDESASPDPQSKGSTSANLISTVTFDNFEIHSPESSASDLNLQSHQAEQPEKGKLVFVSDHDGNRNIYTIFTNGKGLNQLTFDLAADYAPRWSPDGNKIVFVSERDGNPEIYMMDADGKNVTRLTDNLAEDISPDWSPDGKQIIFSSKRSGNYDLYLMSSQGEKTEISQLTNTKFDEMNPSISPDGTKILFQANEKTEFYKIYVMAIDGTQRNPLTSVYFAATYSDGVWAPDSLHIAYVMKYGYIQGKIFTGDIKQNPDIHAGQQITIKQEMDLYPTWSPSGKQLAFVSDMDGQSDIYILLVDGTDLFRITYDNAIEESPDWHE